MLTNVVYSANFSNENNPGFLVDSSAKTHVKAIKKIKYEIPTTRLFILF